MHSALNSFDGGLSKAFVATAAASSIHESTIADTSYRCPQTKSGKEHLPLANNDLANVPDQPLERFLQTAPEESLAGFAAVMAHLCQLYAGGESSSISEEEGYQLAQSARYVLGHQSVATPRERAVGQSVDIPRASVTRQPDREHQSCTTTQSSNASRSTRTVLTTHPGTTPQPPSLEIATALLAQPDPIAAWTNQRRSLEAHIPAVMNLLQEVVSIMPPIRNIALRDTLASLQRIPALYDTFFNAHEVPGSIDYPLSTPAPDRLQGLDYVEVWLFQLLKEARYLAQFDTREMERHLQSWCPDYQGLLINLYDPIHEAHQKGILRPRHCPTGRVSELRH